VGAEELGKRDKMMQRVPKMNQRRKKEGRVVEEDKRQEGTQGPSLIGELYDSNAINRVRVCTRMYRKKERGRQRGQT